MCRTDRECIEYCLDGRPDAFRHLVGRYQGVLLSYLAGQLGSRERAEEAAQEAFVRAYFALNRIEKPESFFSWLLGIAGRVAKEQRRTERREREVVAAKAAEAGPSKRSASPRLPLSECERPEKSSPSRRPFPLRGDEATEGRLSPSPRPSPLKGEGVECRSPSPPVEMSSDLSLERAIGELPDVYRDVVLLRYYAGRSCVQVAQDLGIPLGTVTKRLSRAYAMLRELLAASERSPERPEVRP